MTVVVRPDPGLGFVAVNVWHGVGSLHDPPGRSGLAHVVEHILFGAAGDDAAVTHRGESANATTAFERTVYVGTGSPDALPTLLDQAVRRLRPRTEELTASALDRHCRVVLEEIRQREESAAFGSGARRGLRLLFGPDHAFGLPPMGRPGEIAAITPDDVEEFVEDAYARAPVIVTIVGSVEPEYALDLAGRRLAGLASERRSPDHTPVGPAGIAGPRREDVREGSPTALLRYTFALPPEGERLAVAAEVTMAALAGSAWSLLDAELVREHRVVGAVAQHVRCGTGSSIGLVKVSVPAGVDLDRLDQDLTARWTAPAREGLDEGVLQAARARRGKEYLAVLSRARSCAEELCHREAWERDATRPMRRLRAIHEVRAEDVARIASRHLSEPALVAFHAEDPRGTSWIV
ncbi:insulinase family protein [Embleya sp. NBC_00888]|uniref:M16 family metallopeptidase n=1 Tax=Embleya sp. NBC_00888 TaxID=2975960 RepID=UPI003863C29A|nr:insulinase family protein [Embleya sp. NBC_00888]